MRLLGACRCNNIGLIWHNVDFSLVPRSCQCDYCRGRGAAWVSKRGSALQVKIRRADIHSVAQQGAGLARFHECLHCGDVACVTADIEGDVYGAVNVHALLQAERFPPPRATDFSAQSGQEKLSRWQQNWCCPVSFS